MHFNIIFFVLAQKEEATFSDGVQDGIIFDFKICFAFTYLRVSAFDTGFKNTSRRLHGNQSIT